MNARSPYQDAIDETGLDFITAVARLAIISYMGYDPDDANNEKNRMGLEFQSSIPLYTMFGDGGRQLGVIRKIKEYALYQATTKELEDELEFRRTLEFRKNLGGY